jgi:hypothetical protein
VRNSATLNGEYRQVCGIGEATDESGHLSVIFDGSQHSAPYFVLGTDYENWAAVWSCFERDGTVIAAAHLLTRKPNPDPEMVI